MYIKTNQFNPLSPNGDQQQFSPNDVHTSSTDKVTRINKMITKEKMPGSFIKFSQLILKKNVWRSVWRIYMWILGLKGLMVYCPIIRASDISRGRGSAKFRYFREIPRNSPKNAKYREIRQKYFQIHVGKTYLILILAIRPVLFSPNVQIYLETSSL